MNGTTRKFRDTPSYGHTVRSTSGRVGIKGNPYKPMDRFSLLLMWGAALMVTVALVVIDREIILPWLVLGAPISIGLACLFSRMVNNRRFTRLLAVGYAVVACIGVLGLAGAL